jgi:miniconductance mechanosensitive channel
MNLTALPLWFADVMRVSILFVGAFVLYRITVRVGRGAIRKAARRTKSTWDDRLIERKVFARLANALPGAIVLYGIAPALGLVPGDLVDAAGPRAVGGLVVQRVALAWIVMSFAMAANALLNAINDIYNESYSEANSRPIKGYLQVVGLAMWIGVAVVVVSILADRSPIVFLSGLGALTAVLMLVFRDTILSLVASMQIMSNDMIRIGDWVEMPQANADGDVIDIALHTVKVQNWDKTISTIPTHKFISESFKNWRGMSESGGRRIKRSLNLDMSSIRFLTEEEIEHLSRYELLVDYMTEKQRMLTEYRAGQTGLGEDVIPEPRKLTNIGTFRAYVAAYLASRELVHDGMTLLVRQLAPTPKGIPMEIYCFTSDTAWVTYERVQSDIFDHLVASLPEFGLKAFQEPAGGDFDRIAQGA